MYDSLEYLNNCLFPTGIPANISISTNSERVTQTRDPFSYFLGSEKNGQAFSIDSFLLGLNSSYVSGDNGALKYEGYDGGRELGGYGSFGGPMSCYLGPQMASLNLSNEAVTRLELAVEENSNSNKSEGKLLISSAKEHDREKMPQTKRGGRRGRQANKRPRQGAHQQYNSAANSTSSVFEGLSDETCSATAVKKALWEAREALENYPSQEM